MATELESSFEFAPIAVERSDRAPLVLILHQEREVLDHKFGLPERNLFVLSEQDPARAEELLWDLHPDLILLDEANFFSKGIEWRRQGRNEPMIVVPGGVRRERVLNRSSHAILALEAGADDYIDNPQNSYELVLKVNSIVRRSAAAKDEGPIIDVGDLRIDLDKRTVQAGGRLIRFTNTEWRVFAQFAINHGRIVSENEIITKLYGSQATGPQPDLIGQIYRLRARLGEEYAKYIHTFAGVGHMFSGQNAIEIDLKNHGFPENYLMSSFSENLFGEGETIPEVWFFNQDTYGKADVARHILAAAGFKNRTVNSLDVPGNRPDLVITTDLANIKVLKKSLPYVPLLGVFPKEDTIKAFQAGVDACVGWPVAPRRLAAVAKELASAVSVNRDEFLYLPGQLKLDTKTGAVFSGRKVVPISRQEAHILALLSRDLSRPLSTTDISNLASRANVSVETLRVHIWRIRLKLGKNSILSTNGGYALNTVEQ